MKTRHNPKTKKLSTAMRTGYAIAKENGIKRIVGSLFELNNSGEICGACALGFALIGKYGLKNTEELYKEDFTVFDKAHEDNKCLLKTVSSVTRYNTLGDYEEDITPVEFVWNMNDNKKTPINKLVEKLEKCKL